MADPADIAVIIPPRQLTTTLLLEPAQKKNVIVTQEVYFLGFPFGSSAGEFPAFGIHPVPIAKHGILSAIGDGNLVVDALNNPGFSGGPIVFRDLNTPGSAPVFYVLGVTKGFFPDLVHVTEPENVQPGEDLSKVESWRIQKDGKGQPKSILRDTSQLVPLNSGILLGTSIDCAIDVIHQHPIGPVVSK